MAKRKTSAERPQAKHKPKSRSSQHGKRKRLDTRNPLRRKTVTAKVPLTGQMAVLVTAMARVLDSRTAFRLSIIMAGMMLADDRRVAASWFMAAGVQDDWEPMRYQCRGSMVTRESKTFLATSRLVSGVIRVVIVRFDDGGWAAYFSTDAEADVRSILETVPRDGRSQRIPLHIAQHRQRVFIGLDGKRFESPVPDMAAAFVVPIITSNVRRHHSDERRRCRHCPGSGHGQQTHLVMLLMCVASRDSNRPKVTRKRMSPFGDSRNHANRIQIGA